MSATQTNPGDRFRVRRQGYAITPAFKRGVIVWSNDMDVWYRLDDETIIKQTPKVRFLEILKG